jgi:hypothetical protein
MSVQNYSTNVPGIWSMPFFLGTITADATKKVAFKAPCALKVLGFSTFAASSSGTTPTLTADLLEGGVSMLTAVCNVVADTVTEATISDDAIADEATVTVNLDIGGTSTPTFVDVTLLLTVMRS